MTSTRAIGRGAVDHDLERDRARRRRTRRPSGGRRCGRPGRCCRSRRSSGGVGRRRGSRSRVRLLGEGDGVADVRRDVVARRLEAQPVLHRQCVPDHPERLPAADRLAGPPRDSRRAEVLVGVAVPLVDLDDRLVRRVRRRASRSPCRWPRCARRRCRRAPSGSRRASACRRRRRPSLSDQARQGPDAALREHHVAVPVRDSSTLRS